MRGKQNRAMIISAQTMGWDPNVITDSHNTRDPMPETYIGGLINLRVDGVDDSPEGTQNITDYSPGHPDPKFPGVDGAPQSTAKRSKPLPGIAP